MNEWISLAISWVPFVALIAVWFWLARKGLQPRGSSGATMIELYEQQVAETRRMNGLVERIAVALEKRESSSIPGA